MKATPTKVTAAAMLWVQRSLVGPDTRLVVVASPVYFKRHAPPATLQDLVVHAHINLRLATQGGLYAWEFKKDHHPLHVRVDGQLTFNTIRPMVEATVAGYGIAIVPEDSATGLIAKGTLFQVLDDWCQPMSGFHLTTRAGGRTRRRSGRSSTI